MKEYYENIFDEILQLLKDNFELIYRNNDDAFIEMKKYCEKNKNKKYKPLEYFKLLSYTIEALKEFVNELY